MKSACDGTVTHFKLCKMFPLFSDALPQGTYYVKSVGITPKSIQIKTRKNAQFNDGLFADDIWPGAVLVSDYVCKHPDLCRNKKVVELGAGGALPSAVALCLNADHCLITDYPEKTILQNIEDTLSDCGLDASKMTVRGFKWGENIFTEYIRDDTNGEVLEKQSVMDANAPGYDLMILAELLWKDTYALHDKLLQSINDFMQQNQNMIILCAFAHRPTNTHSREHDMEFINKASKNYGLRCELLETKRMADASSGGGDEAGDGMVDTSLYKMYKM